MTNEFSPELLAQAFVDTVRDPMLVLDGALLVIGASRSFYDVFSTTSKDTIGHKIYDLGLGEWNNPDLRLLLEQILPERGVMDNFAMEQDFPMLGKRSMLLNARQVQAHEGANKLLLLAIEDVTERNDIARKLQILSDQKDTLLLEMGHRVGNSLQIVGSILMLKARSVKSDETREQLEDAHRRVMSVATLQKHLAGSGNNEKVVVGTYLTKLCASLAESMIGDTSLITLKVQSDEGELSSEQSVSLGLVVVELVINALKHAFSDGSKKGLVLVNFEMNDLGWKLVVSDDGRGMLINSSKKPAGLGTALVSALSQQLDAEIETASTPDGTIISLTHATLKPRLHEAA